MDDVSHIHARLAGLGLAVFNAKELIMRDLTMFNTETAELTDDDLSIVVAGTAVAGTVKPTFEFGEIRGKSTQKDHKDW